MKPVSYTTPTPRALWIGIGSWAVFAVVAVALRGVRWEETYEHGLVITGIVPYPEGHPAFRYCRNIFSGQSYLTALLIWLWDLPVLINGLRNVAQLLFTTVPVFLLGARFGNNTRWGHVAVVFVLLAVHQNFQSYYPIEPWPYAYGNGQIGVGFALLILSALLYGYWRTAWFMLGLLVMIHLGQLPVIGALAGAQWLVYLYRGRTRKVLDGIVFFALGLIPCITFYLIQRQFHVSPPDAGAYAVAGDAQSLWVQYTENYDIHRGTPRFNPFWKSWIAPMLVLLLAGGCGFRSRREEPMRDVFVWTAVFAVIVSVTVGGIWVVHQWLGASTPFLLIGWMPYRLTNHLAILLVPLCVGAMAYEAQGDLARQHRVMGMVGMLFIFAAGSPIWQTLLPTTMYTHYVGNPELLIYFLCGFALTALLANSPATSWRRSTVVAFLAPGIFFLAIYYPFGLAAMFLGVIGYGVAQWVHVKRLAPTNQALTGAMLVVLILLLFQQTQHREHLPIHPLQARVLDCLADRGEQDVMIVTPYWDIAWTPRTRLATFTDYMLPTYISYMPDLAPCIDQMQKSVYGIGLDGSTEPPLASWPARSRAEWQALGAAYGFSYVLAPTEMVLQLPELVSGEPYDLYAISP